MKQLRLFLALILAVGMCLAPSIAFGVPDQIFYQGKLTDSTGVPIHGELDVTFTLYDSPTDNAVLWRQAYNSSTQRVILNQGHFDVKLGSIGSPLSPDVFRSDSVFLGIKIADDVELSPRIQLLTSPYAFQASNAERLGGIGAEQYLGPQVAIPGQLNATENPVHWTKLKGVPDSVVNASDEAIVSVSVSGDALKTLRFTRTNQLPDLTVTFNVGTDQELDEAQIEGFIANDVASGYVAYSDGHRLQSTSLYFTNGRLGINTTTPRSALDVSGSVSISGNVVLDGALSAGSLQGDGSAITQLDAGNISSGTLGIDRLPSSVSLMGDGISSSEIIDGTITNLDISDGAAIAASKLASTVLVEGDALSTLTNDAGYITSASTVIGLVRSSEASSNYILGTLGVGTEDPAASLDVKGSAIIRGDATVSGALSVPHNATIQSLDIQQEATINGALTVGGALSATGPLSSGKSFSAPIATLTTLNVTSITAAGPISAGDVSADSLIVTDVTANAIVATTVSGDGSGLTSLQAVQLNGILSIPQGGTGALSSANALRNLGGLPLSGGDLSGPLSVPTNSFSVGDSQFVVSSDAVSIQGPLSVSSTTNVDAIRFSDGSSLRSASALQGLSSSSLSDAAGRPNALLIDNEGNVRIATDNTAARLAVGGDIVADRFIGAVSANQLTGAIPVSRGGTGVSSIAALSDSLNLATLASRNTVSNDLWDSNSQLAVAHGGTGASTPAGARTALELGTLATLSSVGNAEWAGGALTIANGGTGATSSANALAALGGISSAGGTFSGSVSLPNNGLAVGTTLVVTDNKVGIGTNTPEQTLDVNGSAYVRSGEIIIGDTADSRSSIERTDNDNFGYNFRHNTATILLHEAPDSSSEQVLFLAPSNAASSDPLFGVSIHDGTAWRPRMTLSGEGKLGVGVITPTATVHVNGTIQATSISADGSNLTSLNPRALSEPVPLELGGTGHSTSENVKTRFRTILELGQLAYTDNVGSDDWDPNDVLAVDKGGTGADNAEEARGNLGLGDLAAMNSVGNGQWTPGEVLSIANGGTGAANVSLARLNLGAVFKGGDTMTGALALPNGGLSIGDANSQIKTTYDAGTQTQRLGIMTAAPDYTLDVAGDIGMDGTLFHNGNAAVNLDFGTNAITINAGANTGFVLKPSEFSIVLGGMFGLSAVRDGQDLTVTLGDQNTSSNLNDTVFVRGKQHSVGIGVDNPTATLDINGTLRVSSGVYFDSTLFVDGTIDTGQGSYELYGTDGDLLSGTGISITGGGDNVLYGTDQDIRITHADTSSLNSFTVTPGYVVTGLTLDSFGHVQNYVGDRLDSNYAPLTQNITLGFSGAASTTGTWGPYTPPAGSLNRFHNSTQQTSGTLASATFLIPSGMQSAFMSLVTAPDGGFVDVFLVKSGTSYFYRRVATRAPANMVRENLRLHIASSLSKYDAIKIVNGAGTFRFTGLAFSRQDLPAPASLVDWTTVVNAPSFAVGDQTVNEGDAVTFKKLTLADVSGGIPTQLELKGRDQSNIKLYPDFATSAQPKASIGFVSANSQVLLFENTYSGEGANLFFKAPGQTSIDSFAVEAKTSSFKVQNRNSAHALVTKFSDHVVQINARNGSSSFNIGLNAPGGFVGVGTTSPQFNLDVAGDIRAMENLIVGQDAVLENDLNVTGVSTFNSVVEFRDGLNTVGTSVFSGGVSMNSGLEVSSATIAGALRTNSLKIGSLNPITQLEGGSGLTVQVDGSLDFRNPSAVSDVSLSGTDYINGLTFNSIGLLSGISTSNLSGNFLSTNTEWIKGFADRVSGSGSTYTAFGNPAWGFPRFKPSSGAHGAHTFSTGQAGDIDFDIPTASKTSYVAMSTSDNGGYVDVWLRLSVDGTWIFHRRLHHYQDVQFNHDNDAFTKGGNIVVLAATGLDDQWGNRRFDRIRFRNMKGDFRFMGVGFTREDMTGGQDSGYVHFDNVFGNLRAKHAMEFSYSVPGDNGLRFYDPSNEFIYGAVNYFDYNLSLDLLADNVVRITDIDTLNGSVSGNSFLFNTNNGDATFDGRLLLHKSFVPNGGANSVIMETPTSIVNYGFKMRLDSDYFNPGTHGNDAVIFEKTDGSKATPAGGFVFANKGSTGTSTPSMVIRGNGNVGIGTTTPVFPMDIRDPSGAGLILIRDDSSTQADDFLGGIGFDSNDGSPPNDIIQSSAAIMSFSAEAHSSSDKGGILTFHTAPINQNDLTASPERLRIDSNGRVSINHPTNNTSALSVRQYGEKVTIIDNTTDPSIELRDQDSDGSGPYMDFVNDDVSDFDARLQLTADDKLQLSGAKLGIGVNPSFGLHVSGWSKLNNVGIQADPNTDYHITLGGTDLGINMGNKSIASANSIVFNSGSSFTYDAGTNRIAVKSADNTDGSLALFGNNSSNKGELFWDNNGFGIKQGGQTFMLISMNDYLHLFAGNTQKGLTVASNGNVGIKGVTPSHALHVNGGAYITGRTGIGTAPPSSGSYLKMGGNIDLNSNSVINADEIKFGNGAKFDNGGSGNLDFFSAGSGAFSLHFRDAQGNRQGSIHTDGHNSSPRIGLLDKDGNWAVEVKRDQYVQFKVNNQLQMKIDTAKTYVYDDLHVQDDMVVNDDVTIHGSLWVKGRAYFEEGFNTDNTYKQYYQNNGAGVGWNWRNIGGWDYCALSRTNWSWENDEGEFWPNSACSVKLHQFGDTGDHTASISHTSTPSWHLGAYRNWYYASTNCAAICMDFE